MNILSFDIEEWYLYQRKNYLRKDDYLLGLNNYLDRVLDVLDNRGFKSTFFCLGIVAREYPEVIRRIYNRGHEVGCHSDKHHWLTELSFKELREDTRIAVDSIESVIGQKVKSYRAPAFSITESNKWVFEVLAENGIERDASIFPLARDFGGFPSFAENIPLFITYNGIKIKEFPVGTMKVWGKEFSYSGGGYFRIFPYGLIKRELRISEYGMIYLHMRDFDKNQKRTYNFRYIKNYYGVNQAFNKFSRLIADFDFINLETADEMTDWSSTKVVSL